MISESPERYAEILTTIDSDFQVHRVYFAREAVNAIRKASFVGHNVTLSVPTSLH